VTNSAARAAIPQADPGAGYARHKQAVDAAMARVLESGRYILGEEVRAFETGFAAWLGVRNAVGVASGTDAIELALRALDIGPGSAVICPSHTAVATVAAIQQAGARPVLVDVDPLTYTLSAPAVETALRHRKTFGGCAPAAIVAVHLYGQPADMRGLLDVAGRYKLRVVEDCAQSHGARLGGRFTGGWGDAAAFSFYPTKNLPACGDGGAVVTNDDRIAERVRLLRQYGWDAERQSLVPGVNSRLDELQAAILRVRLKTLEADNARRRAIAERYSAGLPPCILPPARGEGVEHVFHQYVIRTPRRDELRRSLAEAGIATAVHYPVPVHRQPAYRDAKLTAGDLAATEALCSEIVSLPMYPELSDDDVDRVIEAISDWDQRRPQTAAGAEHPSARGGRAT
jgi:dTDP-4-amino-4,6-dideoxygalactose transaminase